MLQRVRDLSVQGANSGAQSTESLAAIQAEITQLGEAITDIATRTKFNGQDLLTTTAAGTGLDFHVGAGSADTLHVDLVDLEAVGTAVAALTAGTAADIDTIDGLIEDVSSGRAELGASQNRLEHTISSINVSVENLTASESRIRDTDMAQEMMSFTRSQILSQAGTSMLAQANQSQQGVLSLLR
jgi:flagellin